jgi:spore germination cell wall hydrolase CwlJ-like protein
LFELLQARVSARAVSRTLALMVAIVAGVGGSAVAARFGAADAAQSRSERVADAAARGFSESALRAQTGGMSSSALSIAERFDPYAPTDDAAAAFAARLERRQGGEERAAEPAVPPAAPFRTGGALSSARELECLSQAVYYEARGEGPSGQAAVAQVVLNRVRHPAFPKSVCGVVFQGASAGRCQFSFACDGSIRRTHEAGAWRRAQRVAASALSGRVAAEVGNATHFHAARIAPGGGRMVRVAAIGQHVFYRVGGRSGAPDAFRARYRPESEAKTVFASMLPTQLLPAKPLEEPVRPAAATAAPKAAAPTAPAIQPLPAPVSEPAPYPPPAAPVVPAAEAAPTA